MQESVDLAVDPSSPDAPVEEHFFKEGVASEGHARDDGQVPDDWSKRARRLRMLASGAIATVGLVAIGLLIWGGPSQAPATVAVLSPAAAAPAPPPPPAPAPVETPPAAPVVAMAAATPAPAPAAPAPDPAPLEQRCRDAFDHKRYKDVLESCGRAFEARPTGANLAVLVAESEMDRGHAAASLAWARKALLVDPDLAEAYVFVGTAEQQAGHAQAARTAYLKYLELAPAGRFAQELKSILADLK
jgi:tetratricopeptide (TPR) repeat protein